MDPRSTRAAALIMLGLLAGCYRPGSPPPSLSFEDLPVSGTLVDAVHAGFNSCTSYEIEMRCARKNVMIEGQGPFNAAVVLDGDDGSGGFDQLVLWHDKDQGAVLAIVDAFKRKGWKECFTGDGRAGNQAIYTLKGSPIFLSMDISYWAKRRVRLLPAWRKPEAKCWNTVPASERAADKVS